jgi:hypothetical protein
MNSHITNLYPKPTQQVTAMEMLTVSNAVKQFATSYSDRTKYITLDIQDNDVYVTYTGETPSATVGHILYAGNSYTWSKATATAAKFIRVGGDAVIAASEFTE